MSSVMAVNRKAEFEGIYLTPNPAKKSFYSEASVRRCFHRDSVMMDNLRYCRLTGEYGSPDLTGLSGAWRLRRKLDIQLARTCFQIQKLDYEWHEQNGVKLIYPQAEILLVGPMAKHLMDNWGRVKFVPRVIYDCNHELLHLSRIITWDAVLQD